MIGSFITVFVFEIERVEGGEKDLKKVSMMSSLKSNQARRLIEPRVFVRQPSLIYEWRRSWRVDWQWGSYDKLALQGCSSDCPSLKLTTGYLHICSAPFKVCRRLVRPTIVGTTWSKIEKRFDSVCRGTAHNSAIVYVMQEFILDGDNCIVPNPTYDSRKVCTSRDDLLT